MRRFLLLILILLAGYSALAQIEVKDDSFKEVDGFVNIENDMMYDDNGKLYAVLKIRTENINNKQRRNFYFGVDPGVSFEVVFKHGEVWLYISYYAKNLNISSPDFNTIDYIIPMDMKPKAGYEMTIVNKAEPVEMGFAFIDITTKPENGATVFIDGQMMNKKTPYSIELPPGKHEITVIKELYEAVTRTVDLKADEELALDIDMPLTGSFLILNADQVTSVYLDGALKGKGSWQGALNPGQHTVLGKKPNHHDFSQTLSLASGETRTIQISPQLIVKEQPKQKVKTPKPAKTPKPKKPKKVRQHRDGYESGVFGASYAMDLNGTQSIGVEYAGRFNTWTDIDNCGVFVSIYGGYGNKFKYTDRVCDDNYVWDGGYPAYTGKVEAHNTAVLGGITFNNSRALSFRIGGGYQRKWIGYEISLENTNMTIQDNENWVRNADKTFKGGTALFGVQYYFEFMDDAGIEIIFDVVSCMFQTVDFKLGIGIAM